MIPGDFLDRIPIRFRRGSLAEHYRDVLNSDSGRIVLADLCRKGGVMIPYEGGSMEQLAYATGRRDIVLYILARLRMQPQDLQQIAGMEVRDE